MIEALLLAAVSSTSISMAEAGRGDAMALTRLLPPSERSEVTAGTVRRAWLPGQFYELSWWTAAKPSGGLCERRLYTATADDLRGGRSRRLRLTESVRGRVQFALAGTDGCSNPSGWITPPPGQVAASIEALHALRDTVFVARQGYRVELPVACREDPLEGVLRFCGDPRNALAMLPLHRLNFFAAGEAGRAEFGMSPGDGDGLSWRATLTLRGDRVSAVDIMRTTIIAH